MSKLTRREALSVLGAALLANSESVSASENRLSGLDRYIEQTRTQWKNVGLAVAVVHDGKVVYASGFGVKQAGKKGDIDPNTLFQIGSTTKAFTAAVLGTLVDEGKVRWDDPLIDYLPAFQLHDPWLTKNVTVRDALSHRSGVSFSYYPFLCVMSAEDAVHQLRYVAPDGAFRDSYRYSNQMYAAAGQVAAAASGMSWSELVRHRLLQPLRMRRSGTSPTDFWESRFVTATFLGNAESGPVDFASARDSNLAMPHGYTEGGAAVVLPWQSYDNAAPAGSIVSSVADMANWLILHLSDGRFDGKEILKPQTMRELHAMQNPHGGTNVFPFDASTESYALGWQRAIYQGKALLSHGGGIIGFPAFVALVPEQKIGVVVLSNGAQAPGEKLGLHRAISLWVVDRLTGAPDRDWNKDYLRQAETAQLDAQHEEEHLRRSRLPNAPPSLSLDKYVGRYEDARGHSGPTEVGVEGGKLSLSFAGHGAYRAELEHWHHDMFRVRSNPGVATVLGPLFASFEIDATGTVAAMSVFDATFTRVP